MNIFKNIFLITIIVNLIINAEMCIYSFPGYFATLCFFRKFNCLNMYK